MGTRLVTRLLGYGMILGYTRERNLQPAGGQP